MSKQRVTHVQQVKNPQQLARTVMFVACQHYDTCMIGDTVRKNMHIRCKMKDTHQQGSRFRDKAMERSQLSRMEGGGDGVDWMAWCGFASERTWPGMELLRRLMDDKASLVLSTISHNPCDHPLTGCLA